MGPAAVERLRRDGATRRLTGRDEGRGEAVGRPPRVRRSCAAEARDREGCDRALCGGRRAVRRAARRARRERRRVSVRCPLAEIPREAFAELLEVNLTALFPASRARRSRRWPAQAAGPSCTSPRTPASAALRHYHVLRHEGRRDRALGARGRRGRNPRRARERALPRRRLPRAATPGGGRGSRKNRRLDAAAAGPLCERAKDIAAAIAWLLSDEARHVTGATLRVDGGSGAVLPASTRSG